MCSHLKETPSGLMHDSTIITVCGLMESMVRGFTMPNEETLKICWINIWMWNKMPWTCCEGYTVLVRNTERRRRLCLLVRKLNVGRKCRIIISGFLSLIFHDPQQMAASLHQTHLLSVSVGLVKLNQECGLKKGLWTRSLHTLSDVSTPL